MDVNNTTLERPLAERVIGATVFILIILSTVIGNSLVVLAVFTYRPLKKVQNLFIISLSVADLCVATLVMPYHVVQFLGQWNFSFELCQAWVTFDILLCTCSILNLCAIALDRFWAIHDPVNYANRRTKNLVLIMIFCVWSASALISVPPLFGWNDWSGFSGRCQYTSETGFVIFSAFGSFFIPFLVMLTVYIRIYRSAKDRLRRRLLSRSASMRSNASRAASFKKKTSQTNSASGPTPLELLNALQNIDTDNGDNTGSIDEDIGADEAVHTHLSDQALITPEMFAVGLPGGSDLRDLTGKPLASPQLARSITSKIDQLKSKPKPEVVAPSLIQSANYILANGPVARQRCQRRSRYANAAKTKQSIRRTGSECSVSTSETMSTYFKEREKISITKEKRAAKTLAIIMGAFVMCWFPFFTLYLIRPLCTTCEIPSKLFEAANWLGYVNSSINPVIYTVFNTDFRNAFRNLFSRCKPSNLVSKL